MQLTVPSGSEVRRIEYTRRLQSIDQAWEVRLEAGGQLLESCVVPLGAWECNEPPEGSYEEFDIAPGEQTVELGAWCLSSSCAYTGGPLYDFAAVIYSSVVTVEENTAPTASSPTLSGLSNGWVGPGGATASMVGSDTLGLKRLELVVDGSVSKTVNNAGCVDWSVLPCSDTSVPGLGPGFSGQAAIEGVKDGLHQVQARAVDAAGNIATSGAVEVKVDRTAPSPPVSEDAILNTATAKVEWSQPVRDDGSPVVKTRARICTGTADPLTCRWENVALFGSADVPLGADGDRTTVQIEMTDAAGNVGLSPVVNYRRDTSGPAAPGLTLTPGSGGRRTVSVAATEPFISGYVLRVCDAGGNNCSEANRAAKGSVDVELAAPGLYRVEVALIDEAGNRGAPGAVAVDYPKDADKPGDKPGEQPGDKPLATGLRLDAPSKLKARATVIQPRGSVKPGSASKVTVTVRGRPAGRKRSVTYTARVTPVKSGKWSAKLKLPRGVSRRKGVLVTVTATPAAGYAAATISRRIRG